MGRSVDLLVDRCNTRRARAKESSEYKGGKTNIHSKSSQIDHSKHAVLVTRRVKHTHERISRFRLGGGPIVGRVRGIDGLGGSSKRVRFRKDNHEVK